VFQDLYNYIRILNDCDYLHGAIAIGAYERIHLVYFMYQARPVLSKLL